MKKLQKNRPFLILVAVLVLALLVGVLAYFSDISILANKLFTGEYGTQMVERFTPEDDWRPGQRVDKVVGVHNTGDYPLLVRVKMSETWTFNNGFSSITVPSSHATFNAGTGQLVPDDGLTAGDGSVVEKEIAGAGSGWTKDAASGYWYFGQVLAPAISTSNLMSAIKLIPEVDMGKFVPVTYYTFMPTEPDNDDYDPDPLYGWTRLLDDTQPLPDGTTFMRVISVLAVDSNSVSLSGYASAQYNLTITYETYQATPDARADAVTNGGWSSTLTPVI